MKKENNNNGCAIIGIIVFLLCLWGFSGMMDGQSFAGGIGSSVKALGILVIVGLAIYGFIKLNDK
ncbi:hypothetical protein N8Z48_02165 [Algibacter sp.]|nr:hypothetical protein [Algibacter sp.]